MRKGVMLRTDKRYKKTILTTEGYLTWSRNVLRPKSKEDLLRLQKMEKVKSIAPIDSYLKIDRLPFKITIAMMLQIARHAIEFHSYQDVSDFYKNNWDIQISDDQIRQVVDYIGAIVYEEDCRLAEEALKDYNPQMVGEYAKADDNTLYLEMDGAMFNTRGVSSGWRENKLGMAFDSKNIYTYTDKNGKLQHRILKREYISYAGNAEDFRKHLLALARRNGCETAKYVIILSDGAAWIKRLKKDLFPYAIQILDLFHLKENVGKFAIFHFKNNYEEYHPWANNVCEQLENGRWKEVLSLRELLPYKDGKTVPEGIVNLYHYVWNNRDCIDYPHYKRMGFFVGSGAIESGNKTVLQERLKLPGMRWNIDKAQGVLSLRAKDKSGLWESYVVPLVFNYIGQK